MSNYIDFIVKKCFNIINTIMVQNFEERAVLRVNAYRKV